MVELADIRLIKLAQKLDQERQARIAAQRKASVLQATITRMKQRTTDSKPRPPAELRR